MTTAPEKIREGSGPTLYRQKSGVPGADGSRDLELVQWTDNTGRGAVVTLTGYVGNRWECLGLFLNAAQCRELARALVEAAGRPRHDQCVTCGGALSLDPFDPSGDGRICPRCDGGAERLCAALNAAPDAARRAQMEVLTRIENELNTLAGPVPYWVGALHGWIKQRMEALTPRHDQCVICGGALSLDPFDPSETDRICPKCDGGGERSEPLDPVCACGLVHGHAGLCAENPNEYNRALSNDGEERREYPEDDWRDER